MLNHRWNSYNHYSCSPTEAIIHSNAQAVVDLGLQAKGYHYVTVDCGWTLPARIANGTMTWNPALFPSGYFALGQFLHARGLGFGVYADAGIQTCVLLSIRGALIICCGLQADATGNLSKNVHIRSGYFPPHTGGC